ncbi:MAG: hypothetical protein AAEJ47_11130 [Planctomycetota bacterium]
MVPWMLIFLTLLHTDNPELDDPKEPVLPEGIVAPLPYSCTERQEWEWVHDGVVIGKTSIQLIAPIEEKKAWTLDARLRWSRQGRSIEIRQLTDFDGTSLKPIRTRREQLLGALGIGEKRGIVASEIIGTEARVVVQDPAAGTQIDRTLPFPEGAVLLENQCFEHWLLIVAALNRKEEKDAQPQLTRRFSALIPSEYRLLELTLSRDREEKSGAISASGSGELTLWRWSISSSDFEAKIWIGPEGQLERYRQGPLEIRRIHPAKTTPTSEKKTTAG